VGNAGKTFSVAATDDHGTRLVAIAVRNVSGRRRWSKLSERLASKGPSTPETFGTDVADLVAEVTDDKTLAKGERKKRQVESAHKKSDRAKILKLADKTSNLRALVTSPAPDWSVRRKIEYIDWARKVVRGLRGANAAL
jgi:hypothetical protein